MQVFGSPTTTLRYDDSGRKVVIIDQTLLPHRFITVQLARLEDFCRAITTMQVRGAPLIGVTAAFGLALALAEDDSPEREQHAAAALLATRPTAVNLQWAIARMRSALRGVAKDQRRNVALATAQTIRSEDIAHCEAIGNHGADLLHELFKQRGDTQRPLNLLTHCNAGWLATIDWGTALAPIYKAHAAGLPLHIWVDETRPRNQGASLTAWELQQQGIPHTVIADNTGGHLMQQGLVDICLVGSDRTSARGDVCNKIGTYLKALAAKDNAIPFFVALPSSSIDWTITDGCTEIPIEQRDAREVTHISGLDQHGQLSEIQLVADSPAVNYAFDVTPAKLISGLITEVGVFNADSHSLSKLQQQLNQP